MREFSDARLFPTQFATVKEYGDDSYPYWFPMSIDGPIELEEGETLLWSEPLSDLSIPGARNLENASMLVTDRRIAFATTSFTKGATYIGFGGSGSTIAAGAMVVSAHRARKRRQGRILLGQVRLEWITSVEIARFKWFRGIGSRLEVGVRTDEGVSTIAFNTKPALTFEWANWLCQLIAHQRLSEGVPLGPGAIDELNALQAGTSVTDDGALPATFTWTLPGASERMNQHVRERLFGSASDDATPATPHGAPKEWRETTSGLRIQFVDGRMTGRTCLVDPTESPDRQLRDLRQRWDLLPPSVIRSCGQEIEHGRSLGFGPGPDRRIALPMSHPSGAELLSGDASSLVRYLWPQVAADGSVILGPAETAITSWTSYAPHGAWLTGTTESDRTGLVNDSGSSNWRWTLTDRRLVLTYDMPIAESGHGGMQIHHDWACGLVARYQVFSGENQCLVALACGPGEKGAFAVWLNIGEPNQEVGDAILNQLVSFYSGTGRAVSPPAEWTEPKALGRGVVTKRYFAIAGGTGMTLPPSVVGTLVGA